MSFFDDDSDTRFEKKPESRGWLSHGTDLVDKYGWKYVIVRALVMMVVVAFIIGLIIGAAGCGNDAAVSSRDKSGATLFNMPDKFDTVAAKCDGHGHRIFETQNHGSKSSALTAIADPACNGHVGP